MNFKYTKKDLYEGLTYFDPYKVRDALEDGANLYDCWPCTIGGIIQNSSRQTYLELFEVNVEGYNESQGFKISDNIKQRIDAIKIIINPYLKENIYELKSTTYNTYNIYKMGERILQVYTEEGGLEIFNLVEFAEFLKSDSEAFKCFDNLTGWSKLIK